MLRTDKSIYFGGINLFYIIFVLLLLSLIASVVSQSKEHEEGLWLKLIAIYLCYFFSFIVGIVKIPILIIISYFIIKRKSKQNVNMKMLALTFSLILYITINYVVPHISLNQVYILGKQAAMENRFDKVDNLCYYSQDSKIQNRLRRYDSDDPQIMLSVWAYDSDDIEIIDYEWIWRYSYRELDIYWSVNYNREKDYSEAYIRFNRTGQEYIGIFKKDKNGKQYLEYVIEGRLKHEGRPKSIFDIY
jgi:hypothetical protein